MKSSIARWFQDGWYKEMYISSLFMPISMIYADFVRFRRFLYKIGVLKKTKLAVPVIIIGNITVGGTGKTPLVLWMARFLREQGYKPGIISRGYGGESESWPILVDESNTTEEVGDEVVLMARRVDCPIAVSPNRVEAAQLLLDKTDTDIILSDDGLQHYALQRDIEIAVVDGERRFGNGYMLPCGPLREPIERLQEVDFIVVNGEDNKDFGNRNELGQVTERENEYSMVMTGSLALNLKTKEEKFLTDFVTQPCHALAGIGNPKRFFDFLEKNKINITQHAFPDHHQFTMEEISFEDDKPVLMTEKDAVKCFDFATDKHWFVPVNAKLQETFIDKLLSLIKERSRG